MTFADDPLVDCVEVVPFECDGSVVLNCNSLGHRMSHDCAYGHPDLVCGGGGGQRCGAFPVECEENNYNNSGGSAQCMDADVALVCMNGKQYSVSCAIAGAQCVNEGDYDASCVVI